jgi:hypothetical protein
MHNRRTTKALVALIAAGAMLVLAAAPAGAGAVDYAVLVIDSVGIEFPDTNGPCDVYPPGTMTSSVDGIGVDQFLVSDLYMVGQFELTPGDWWRIDVEYLTVVDPGDVGGSTSPWFIANLDMVFYLTFQDVNNVTCASVGGTCEAVMPMMFDGEYLGTIPAPPGSGTVYLGGYSATSNSGLTIVSFSTFNCGSGIWGLDGDEATFPYFIADVP